VICIIEVIKIEKQKDFPDNISKGDFINFLYKHLEEYGDKKEDIEKAINYAFSSAEGKGGFLLIGLDEGEIIGETVINNTGMSGYIPQHILVYIATHKDSRGEGIGTKILEKALEECSGDIALHVEYDNPAVGLYKKVGFKSKYAEMRFKQKDA
jgi:GNAT superfamily N-acetyltransferase